MEFISDLLNRFTSVPPETWQALGVFAVSGSVVSIVQFVLNHWMQSKRVIHTSLLVLSGLVGVFEFMLANSNEIIRYLPATFGLTFTAALTFYRFAGKPFFAMFEQHLEDARIGREMRVPSSVVTPEPTLPEHVPAEEEFAM